MIEAETQGVEQQTDLHTNMLLILFKNIYNMFKITSSEGKEAQM